MSKWLCRIIGHRWGWPDIVATLIPEGLRFLPQWRECERCGHREQDVRLCGKIHVVPAFQGIPRDCGLDGLDAKVKKAGFTCHEKHVDKT